ncbi:hypothetical protein F4778DRAFT_317244 [Xylariomycetidae sp. FL2044]|nr:hypothetical protein F4778DRAFT_317244 [Xylariomycetidae sp. FL2044]
MSDRPYPPPWVQSPYPPPWIAPTGTPWEIYYTDWCSRIIYQGFAKVETRGKEEVYYTTCKDPERGVVWYCRVFPRIPKTPTLYGPWKRTLDAIYGDIIVPLEASRDSGYHPQGSSSRMVQHTCRDSSWDANNASTRSNNQLVTAKSSKPLHRDPDERHEEHHRRDRDKRHEKHEPSSSAPLYFEPPPNDPPQVSVRDASKASTRSNNQLVTPRSSKHRHKDRGKQDEKHRQPSSSAPLYFEPPPDNLLQVSVRDATNASTRSNNQLVTSKSSKRHHKDRGKQHEKHYRSRPTSAPYSEALPHNDPPRFSEKEAKKLCKTHFHALKRHIKDWLAGSDLGVNGYDGPSLEFEAQPFGKSGQDAWSPVIVIDLERETHELYLTDSVGFFRGQPIDGVELDHQGSAVDERLWEHLVYGSFGFRFKTDSGTWLFYPLRVWVKDHNDPESGMVTSEVGIWDPDFIPPKSLSTEAPKS